MASAEILYMQLKQNGDEIPSWLYDMINSPQESDGQRVGGETMALATPITFAPGGTYTDAGTTVGSLNDYDSNVAATLCQVGTYFSSSFAAGDVFYTFTLPENYTVSVDICGGGSWDSALGIVNSAGVIVGENDDNSTVCTGASSKSAIPNCCLPADTYYIVVDGYSTATGGYTLNVTFGAEPCVMPCDSYTAGIQNLTAPGVATGTTVGAPNVYAAASGDQGVNITIPYAGDWNFDACYTGTAYAADLYLFTGNPCAGGTLIASNTSATCAVYTGAARLLNVGLQAGVYHLLVGNASTTAPTEGAWAVNVFETTPVRITSGGPDTFGYAWTNSLNPSGPLYDWVEISAIGSPVTLSGGDGYSTAVPMGMSFPFYSGVYTDVYLGADGYVSFSPISGTGLYTNQILPSATNPSNLIAAFWDDLYNSGATAYTYYDSTNDRFIIEYKNFTRSSVPMTFEVILYPSGNFVVQYQNVAEAYVNSMTLGCENVGGTEGLAASANDTGRTGGAIYDGVAYRFVRPVGDVVPPSIAHTPLINTEDTSTPYTVNADITDLENAVASATLYYQVNGGGYTAVGMSAGTPPAYTAEIPAQAAGSDVQYYISATDTAVPANTGSSAVWSFSVVDYTLPPTGFTASDGVLDVVNLSWSAPAWAVALMGETTPEPRFEDFLPLYASKTEAGFAFEAARLAWQGAQRSFLNYNVYRDGGLIGTSATTTYADVPPTTNVYTYHVTAQFSSRESDPSNSDAGNKSARPTAGGPDASGYSWVNSLDETSPATYDWFDISALGDSLAVSGDDATAAITLPFTFPFYGAGYTTANVCSNGWINFGATATTYSNTALPNAGTPNATVAVFWDDMYVPSAAPTGVVRRYDDVANNRVIIQWTEVHPFTYSTDRFTFQAHLYANGDIQIQYQQVAEAQVADATVGTENAAGTVGLQVNFDNAGGRIADGLAIRITAPEGDWTGPAIAHTPLTNTEDNANPYTVTADITDEDSAVASATLHYQVNGGGYTSVAMTAGTPPAYSADIPAQVGGSDIQYYIVAVDNSVNNNSTTSPTWSFSVVDYTLAPTGLAASDGGYGDVDITWTAPAWAVALSGVEPRFEDFLPLHSTKDAAWTAFQNALGAWQSARSFLSYNVYRDGGLIGTSATTSYTDIPPVENQVYTYHVTALFDAGESTASNSDTGFFAARPTSGGPDAFGYTWMNSDDPSGSVTYSWTDISSAPGAVSYTLTDDSATLLTLPFQFPFYGVDRDSIYVGSNGILGIGASITTYSNGAIPTAGTPDNFFAPFWDDLNPTVGGTVHSLTDAINGKVTVQYTGIFHFGTTTLPYTFQYVLQSDGQLSVYYNDMQGQLDNATVGIENLGGTDGLQANYNDVGSRLTNGLALRIRPLIPCGTPTNVDVVISSGNANLTWDAVDGAAIYRVLASSDGYGTFTEIGTSATNSYTDENAQVAGRKFYQIVAVCE